MAAPSTSLQTANIPLRQRLILDCLLDSAAEITVQDIATEVGASVRTVRRELPDIEAFLPPYNLSLQKKTGNGLRLDGPASQRDALRNELRASSVAAILPPERQVWLGCTLLAATEPLKLVSLAGTFQITITTVSHDIDAVDAWLAAYGLKLQRKRGWGITIDGKESNRRNAIVDLILSQLDEFTLLALFKEGSVQPPSAGEAFLKPAWTLINTSHLKTIGAVLREMEKAAPLALPHSQWLEFALHTSFILGRLASHGPCEAFDDEKMPADKASVWVERFVNHLAPLVRGKIPAEESERLVRILRGVEGAANRTALPESELLSSIRRFLSLCDSALGTALCSDPALVEDLQAHLGRTLQRIRNRLSIRNPILSEIKINYEALFATVQKAAASVFTNEPLPEEEIGYLVLHIGSAMERRRHRQKRALVVCPTGTGTARILASRLRSELPEIEIGAVLSWVDASAADLSAYDIVLSTVPLEWPRESYLQISPLLQEKDAREIRAFLQRKPQQLCTTANRPSRESAAIGKLERLQKQTACALSLVRTWRVHQIKSAKASLTGLLPDICKPLVENKTIRDANAVIGQLSARIKQGGLVISDSRLAFLHARDVGIDHVSFTLHTFAKPITLHDSSPIDRCLLMLAPIAVHRAEIAVLSRISSLLMEPSSLMALSSGDEESAREHLALQLETFLREEKLQE